jgi:hypothetical protein
MLTLRAKLSATALGLLLSFGPAAHATTVLFDNFNGENGGNSGLNYTAFTNWTSTGAGGVDVVKTGDFSLTCAGGSGSCVDLAGSPGPGQITSAASYAFHTGQSVTLSFDVSGNQIDQFVDDMYAGFSFGSTETVNDVTTAGAFVPFNYGPFTGAGFTIGGNIVPGDAPWATYSISWTAASSGTVRVLVGSANTSTAGPLLDNVRLDISGGVPEPATWTLMIGGFFGAGAALRRRRSALA